MHVMEVVIRNAVRNDYEAICALNLDVVEQTSPMDTGRLGDLANLASHFRVACVDGRIAAFVLAISSGAPYENSNFSWFGQRYARFVYIDRVVVASALRGRRLGSLLYQDLFRYACDNEIPFVTCEYNVVPSNEASRTFHDRFGFREQGTQWVANGTKRVSLQVASAAGRSG
jgi:uncharacterized protein